MNVYSPFTSVTAVWLRPLGGVSVTVAPGSGLPLVVTNPRIDAGFAPPSETVDTIFVVSRAAHAAYSRSMNVAAIFLIGPSSLPAGNECIAAAAMLRRSSHITGTG